MNSKETLTQHVVTKLREMGEASAADLAAALGLEPERISDLLRNSFRSGGNWGAFVVRNERGPGIRGTGKNIWAVDEAKYRATLAAKGEAELKPKARPDRPAKQDYIRTYVWPGEILTRWQPSSPYHQVAA